MLINELHIDQKQANELLRKYGNVRNALLNFKK